jgi:hypothetical protein
MSAPETEVLTSRGEKLSDLRKAAQQWAEWLPAEVIEFQAGEESPAEKGE